MKTKRRILLAIPLVALATCSLCAQGITIGSGTTFSLGGATLSLPNNWSNSGTFVPENGLVVFAGASATQTIANASGETFGNLTINKPSGNLQLLNNCAVNGALTLTNGDLDINSMVLTLGSSAILTETPGNTLKGGIAVCTKTLNAPGSTPMIGALITSSVNLGSTTVTRGHTPQAIGGGVSGIARYYEIVPANDAGLNATLVLPYDRSELNGLSESQLVPFRSTDGGTTWQQITGTLDTSAKRATITGINSLSRWTLGTGSIAAPSGPIPPPSSWTFTPNTGNNATIGNLGALTPTIGARSMQDSDAVGVFFMRNDSLICAGYSLWQAGHRLVITAWGDNDRTTMKDGFAAGELIRYKVWDAQAGKELNAMVQYQSGGTTYTTDGIYVLSSLAGFTSVAHSVPLPQGWNMISSFVAPKDSTLDSVFVKIKPNLVIAKNGAGQVYWPSLSLNAIGKWRCKDGYEVYMQATDTVTINGDEVDPRQAPLILSQGWSMVSYLRNSAMRCDSALATIAGSLVIAKNGSGQVYWPALSSNQIGDMKPGAGYKLYLLGGGTLTYPANLGPAPPSLMSSEKVDVIAGLGKSGGGQGAESVEHYAVTMKQTGSNAVLSVEGKGISDGDEVGVWSEGGLLVGGGIVVQGRVVITVWGDDKVTKDVKEGAGEGETLSLKVWQKAVQKEKHLTMELVTDGLSAKKAEGGLRYVADGVWIVEVSEVKEIPTVFSLGQNYPNPFNPSTTIRYGLPKDAKVTLAIYNMLGQKITTLVDEEQKAGYYQVVFLANNLSSGVYFYTISAESYRASKKLTLIK